MSSVIFFLIKDPLEAIISLLEYKGFICVPKDIPRRSIIAATLTSLRVEEKERLVSEEQSDEFQVFPAVRCPGHPREDE